MNFSLSNWISVVEADAKKAEAGLMSILGKVVPAIDSLASVATPILQVVDPAAVPAVTAGKAVIDEVYAAIQHLTAAPAEGVTVTITPDTVTQLLKAGNDAKSWLASIGVK